MAFFYLVTTGCTFDISLLCENSIKSINQLMKRFTVVPSIQITVYGNMMQVEERNMMQVEERNIMQVEERNIMQVEERNIYIDSC